MLAMLYSYALTIFWQTMFYQKTKNRKRLHYFLMKKLHQFSYLEFFHKNENKRILGDEETIQFD